MGQFKQFYGNVTSKQAKLLVEGRPGLIIVDVRFGYEYANGHLENAINICVICNPEILEELNTTSEILIYCQTGIRSNMALKILNQSDHNRVYNMLGGIVSWQEEGYQIVT